MRGSGELQVQLLPLHGPRPPTGSYKVICVGLLPVLGFEASERGYAGTKVGCQ